MILGIMYIDYLLYSVKHSLSLKCRVVIATVTDLVNILAGMGLFVLTLNSPKVDFRGKLIFIANPVY